MSPEAINKAVDKADAIAEMLEHVGWEDHLKPSILTLRETTIQQMVKSSLGIQPNAGYTPEQAAGIVYGIDFFLNLIERALVQGDTAYRIISEARQKMERID